jgi:hypothetical protein
MANIKPTYIKELPSDTVDVSDIIEKKINLLSKDSTNDYVKGLNGIPSVYYSSEQKEFYVKKGDIYKVLRWRIQKVKKDEKDEKPIYYSYEYVLIPYKKKTPIKILESFWLKNFNVAPEETSQKIY